VGLTVEQAFTRGPNLLDSLGRVFNRKRSSRSKASSQRRNLASASSMATLTAFSSGLSRGGAPLWNDEEQRSGSEKLNGINFASSTDYY